MSSPGSDLERALAAFRREHAAAYLRRLAGEPRDPRSDARVRSLLASERGIALFEEARQNGELTSENEAASAAQLARATLEHHYAPARDAWLGLLTREVAVEGETRSLGALIGEWLASDSPSQREPLVRDMGPELERFASFCIARRADADGAVAALLGRLGAPRHPDAGPEGGGYDVAERWLDETAELTREAIAFVARSLGRAGNGGFDHLWFALGRQFGGLFPRDGRLRRLATEWEPLGLRRLLSARARVTREHPGPLPAPHLIPLALPRELRLSESSSEYSLASELTAAEAIGRGLGLAHASEALPFALRFATVGSVARAVGSLAVQRLLEPRFLRRQRGLSQREADVVARSGALYALLDTRLQAAALLARRAPPASALDESAAWAERALLGAVPRSAAWLVLRVAPGGAFRAKAYAPALSFALRERYDEDWYANPRAGEPLRGALARAGSFSVEQFAAELGAELGQGRAKLSELF